jgi:tripartite-type tricarboxylate transporter receptor subunit TctC
MLLIAVFLLYPLLVKADTVATFYKDRNFVLVTGSAAGGGYDLYLRVLAEYLGRYIPGKPQVIVDNRAGGGGLVAMNYIYTIAPKDGSQAIMPANYDGLFQLLRPDQAKYDLRKMNWIGNLAEITSVLAVSAAGNVDDFGDAQRHQVILASSAPSSESFIIPTIMNAVAGTKFKIVTGYQGAAGMFLAMERGEVHGRVGSWYSFKVRFPELIATGRLKVLAQDGIERSSELPNVPLYHELVSDPLAKEILQLTSIPGVIARTLAFPPGVPEERVEALRKAFLLTAKDPDFLAIATKVGLEVHASGHEKVQSLISQLFATRPDVVANTKSILGWK